MYVTAKFCADFLHKNQAERVASSASDKDHPVKHGTHPASCRDQIVILAGKSVQKTTAASSLVYLKSDWQVI